MTATFTFDQLRPDRDTFQLEDGTEIEFLNRTDFDAQMQARARKLGAAIETLNKRLEKNPDSKHDADALHKKHLEFLALILPDMPEGIADTLNAGRVGVIIQWWSEQQEKRFGSEGEV